jgi:glycosyltransferase involved in cell wall biosynthesis
MKRRRVLLLSCFMLPGYGVSEVATQLRRGLKQYGWDLFIGFLEGEPTDDGQVLYMPADPVEIVSFCIRNKIAVVVGQTSPYFEVLPALRRSIPVVCFEHGDPTPEFFREEAEDRNQIRRNKIENVYPNVNRVWTTSHFLRKDIEWPSASVIPLAADHVGQNEANHSVDTGRKIRVGSLSRMGVLESEYKGTDLLIRLSSRFIARKDVEFAVMGRGSRIDAIPLEEAGWSVHLNASDEERLAFLRSLDVFVSPSKWEGFNLPLVEAQFLSVPSIAFDVGAHPETTPYVVSSFDEAVELLAHWTDNPIALRQAGYRCKQFVDSQFSWDRTSRSFAAALDEVAKNLPRGPVVVRRLWSVIQYQGVAGLIERIRRKIIGS